MRLNIDGPGRATSPTAFAIVHWQDGALTRRAIELGRDGDGAKAFRFDTRSVRKLTVTLANASTRYDCWQQQLTYACQGEPRDDGRQFAWKATAFRR